MVRYSQQVRSMTYLFVLVAEGRWRWSDGTAMPLPSEPWHAWDSGQPDNAADDDCSVLTNYAFWAIRKLILDQYIWRDYACLHNPANEIQGYICEGEAHSLLP